MFMCMKNMPAQLRESSAVIRGELNILPFIYCVMKKKIIYFPFFYVII
jgi:hypothetical protein